MTFQHQADTASVYETYYLQSYLQGYSPSTVAWIGSIQAFAQFSATLISGPITDRYGPSVSIAVADPTILTLSSGHYLARLSDPGCCNDAHQPVL